MPRPAFPFLIAALALSACAIQVNVPVNRFDSPEAIGKQWRVKLDTGIGGMNEVDLTNDVTVSPPNTASPTADRGTFLTVGAGVGLLDNLDLEIRNFDEIQAKLQLIGEPRLTAKAGNFAVAVTLGGGFGFDSNSGTGAFNSISYQDHLNTYFADTALILGFRFNELALVYSGPFFRAIGYSGDYATGSSSTTLGSSTSFSGSVSSYGANLGLEIGNAVVQGRIEGAYGQIKSGTLNTGQTYLGAELAFNFGRR